MIYQGIGFSLEWLATHTQAEFIAQHRDAFQETDHPVSKLTKSEKEKWLKDAFVALNLMVSKKEAAK